MAKYNGDVTVRIWSRYFETGWDITEHINEFNGDILLQNREGCVLAWIHQYDLAALLEW